VQNLDRTSQEEGLAPAVAWMDKRGQAPLPDLFYLADLFYLSLKVGSVGTELCDFGVGSFARKKTGPAIDRASLGRVKRDGGLLSALCALHRYFNALSHSRRLRRGDSS